MTSFLRAAAVLALALASTGSALAQSGDASTERVRVSQMVGMDVARSLDPVKGDIDLGAFERAVRNAFAGGKPLLDEAAAREVGTVLMQRVAASRGQAVPGQPPGTPAPAPASDKVGLLVGADVGRSLSAVSKDIDLAVFMRTLRTVMAGGQPPLDQAQADAVRAAFSAQVQARRQAEAEVAGRTNATEGAAFLARNKSGTKGVFSTPSGLQYMVLRQGAGPRPKAGDRVRVNYRGTLLDGSVFDSSYDRGQPAEFPLGAVIAGWQEGLALMPVGAKYRFWIPGELGYGAAGTPDGKIGPNAVLVFDVELMDIL